MKLQKKTSEPAHLHSDTHPPEGVAQIKGVPSRLKVWIRVSNKATFPNSAAPYEFMGPNTLNYPSGLRTQDLMKTVVAVGL